MTTTSSARFNSGMGTWRRYLVVGLVLGVSMVVVEPASAAEEQGAWPTDFRAWSSRTDFARADLGRGVILGADGRGEITLASGATRGTWTSDWYVTPTAFSELVPSWQADTPPGTWVDVGLQARTSTTESRWFAMGAWAFDTSTIERRSTNGQSDAVGRILTDTFRSRTAPPGGQPVAYRLRVTLHGTAEAKPVVRQLGATTSRKGVLPETASQPLANEAVELAVPSYSQTIHSGEYPAFGGGGGVWCSPTSTAMVLSYWGTGPTAVDLATLPPDPKFDERGRHDGQVAWAAMHAWDYVYDGAGNWPFNTAYASAYGLDGSVRQYSTLRGLEAWVRRGVPVVVSINWDNTDDDPTNDLDGSSITGTDGHLMVAVGFTATGDVIANDPASPSNAAVRHVYQRAQFERNWLRASNGTTYVIKPTALAG